MPLSYANVAPYFKVSKLLYTQYIYLLEFLSASPYVYNLYYESNTLTKEIARNRNRVKSFLYYHGITIPVEFSNKSDIGMVPMTNSLGEKESVGGITQRQNKILRSMIIESSWTAIRSDPALMLAYQKLIKRMKPARGIIKISKKIVNRIRYVFNNKKLYVSAVVQ